MRVEKIHLAEDTKLRLVVPSGGFNEGFVNDLATVLRPFPIIQRAYLAQNQVEGRGNESGLLFGLVLDEKNGSTDHETQMDRIAHAVMTLFNAKAAVDFVVLNKLPQVESAFSKLQAQIYP